MTDRTAPFQKIRNTPLGPTTSATGRAITKTVQIPGLFGPGNKPVTVDVTYDIQEIDFDWVSVIVDYQYDSDPTVYGNHPNAVGPLRELLPTEYALPPYPKSRRVARDKVVSMLAHHDLGGWVLTDFEYSTRNLRIEVPTRIRPGDEQGERHFLALVREYIPFDAYVWWDVDNRVVRIRPTALQEEIEAL